MTNDEHFEIGVRASAEGCYGYIMRSSNREQVYLTAWYDNDEDALKDTWSKWQDMRNDVLQFASVTG